ncbi:carbohydrate sulfotransferase 8-like isoform X1 [Ambystoma mexicanum]|uniref:carbohydrate sulfotransferase 8-like isoform X1 n=2 Tax=Ambystoma mexicanum TaxID=8296 RepID=UPI0037E818BA
MKRIQSSIRSSELLTKSAICRTSRLPLSSAAMEKLTWKMLYVLIPCSTLLGFTSVLQLSWYPWNIRPTQNWQLVQLHRKHMLNSMCMKYNLTNSTLGLSQKTARQIFVEETHKVLYCEVPKTGCSNWKRILLLLRSNERIDPSEISHAFVHNTSLLRRLTSYPHATQTEMLRNYTKVMFTRDPFQRLISAYKNKFLHSEGSGYYSKVIARKIKKLFGSSSSLNDSVTFEEFVRYVLHENPKYADTHWDLSTNLCSPCYIQYSILGKFETLNEDSAQVLKRIGAPSYLHFPNMRQYADEVQTSMDMTKRYFRNLSSDQRESFMDKFNLDFTLFNYPIYITNETFQDIS